MLKQRMIKVLVGLALLLVVTGARGMADGLGVAVTAPAYACSNGSGSGGGC